MAAGPFSGILDGGVVKSTGPCKKYVTPKIDIFDTLPPCHTLSYFVLTLFPPCHSPKSDNWVPTGV